MISIQPQHAFNILYRKKTLELRTWIPKEYVGWVYVYVTKGKFINGLRRNQDIVVNNKLEILNGKVGFRFWFDEYDKYVDVSNCGMTSCGFECDYDFIYGLYNLDDELKKLCLTYDEVENYGKGKDLYAWHIKKLEIFDEPKELSDFIVGLNYLGDIIPPTYKRLKRPPQRSVWVYAKEIENE